MYKFVPPWASKPSVCICGDNLFSKEELEQVVKIGDALKMEEGLSYDGKQGKYIAKDYRKCRVADFQYGDETKFVYDKIAGFINAENENNFGFDIYGFVEDFQYLVYDNLHDHFDWHVDISNGRSPYRKLTFVLQLSDPSEYEGGELQLMTHADPNAIPKKLGTACLFPSYVLHRVTPVTKGVRKTLVAWTTGKAFR